MTDLLFEYKDYSPLKLYFEGIEYEKVMSKEEFLIYFNRYKKDSDKAAFDKIVMANIALVIAVSKQNLKYDDSSILDYIQCGIIGLMQAIEKYDIKKGCEFSTYAYNSILNNIKRERYSNRCIKLPECNMIKYYKIQRVIRDFEQENYTTPTFDQIGEILSMDPSEVENILGVFVETTTLQSYSGVECEDNNIEYMIKNEIPYDEKIDDNIISKITLEKLKEDVLNSNNISDFNKMLIYYKIFNEETCKLSLTDIAKIIYKKLGYGDMNITRSEISRRYQIGINQLRRLYTRHCSEEEKKILVK